MGETFLNGRVMLHVGNCLDVLARLEEYSIDSCVTDPPYHLTSIVKRFGGADAAPVKAGAYARATAGFMGKQWDGGDVAFDPATWRAVFRVLKPGGYLVACGGTRTFHRMACAIEDAGFEIRDTISWLYGSGFPKSHDVSKGIDKAAGEQRERIRGVRSGVVANCYAQDAWSLEYKDSVLSSEPITDAAREWEGWGTALKPACELIVLARKPLSEGTVAANVLRWGTGAINVDGCRVAFNGEGDEQKSKDKNRHGDFGTGPRGNLVYGKDDRNRGNYNPPGRWPANVAHDGSDEVVAAFPETNVSGHFPKNTGGIGTETGIYGKGESRPQIERWLDADTGSAARFFYTAKADADDRLGSKHPTVKPLNLMQWLVRMVTPRGGVCLDPFSGTGTTGEAAFRERCNAILIEAEPEYQADIRRRMALALAGPDERSRESIRAKGLPVDYGPLFALPEAAE